MAEKTKKEKKGGAGKFFLGAALGAAAGAVAAKFLGGKKKCDNEDCDCKDCDCEPGKCECKKDAKKGSTK